MLAPLPSGWMKMTDPVVDESPFSSFSCPEGEELQDTKSKMKKATMLDIRMRVNIS
jgi:hypothetical protein